MRAQWFRASLAKSRGPLRLAQSFWRDLARFLSLRAFAALVIPSARRPRPRWHRFHACGNRARFAARLAAEQFWTSSSRLDAMRTNHHLVHARAHIAGRSAAEHIPCSFERITSGEQVPNIERQAHPDPRDPIPADEFFILPIFQI